MREPGTQTWISIVRNKRVIKILSAICLAFVILIVYKLYFLDRQKMRDQALIEARKNLTFSNCTVNELTAHIKLKADFTADIEEHYDLECLNQFQAYLRRFEPDQSFFKEPGKSRIINLKINSAQINGQTVETAERKFGNIKTYYLGTTAPVIQSGNIKVVFNYSTTSLSEASNEQSVSLELIGGAGRFLIKKIFVSVYLPDSFIDSYQGRAKLIDMNGKSILELNGITEGKRIDFELDHLVDVKNKFQVWVGKASNE